jgi:hypothetical protein
MADDNDEESARDLRSPGGKVDMTIIRHFDDLAFTVSAELHDNALSVEFKCYPFVLAHSLGGASSERHYPEPGSPTNFPGVLTIAQSEVYLSGSVRFDRCSNWLFDECVRGTCLHACSREDLLGLGELMARCFDWARELMGEKFCGTTTPTAEVGASKQ